MTEPSWKPLFRTPESTVTKILRSHAFRHAREQSVALVGDAAKLRELADEVEMLDPGNAPLSAVAEHVAAAVRFVRATADALEGQPSPTATVEPDPGHAGPETAADAGTVTRHRLLVASLLYLVERDDLVPDFRPGGYIDDVLALAWVFGACVKELAPYMADLPDVATPSTAAASE